MTETTFPQSICGLSTSASKSGTLIICNCLRAKPPPKPGFGKMILKVLPSSMKFRPIAKSLCAAHPNFC
jgi:hypothetical protein